MGKKAAAVAVASFCELHERLSRFGEGWIFRGHADVELETHTEGRAYDLTMGMRKTLFNAWKLRAVEHHASHIDRIGIGSPSRSITAWRLACSTGRRTR